MSKRIYCGLESSGKSLKLAMVVADLVERNSKWGKVSTIYRPIMSNLRFTDKFIEYATSKGVKLNYWDNLDDIVKFEQCDVIIDEVPVYFDARQWENMSFEVRRWLAQHRHRGVEIYGNVQEFADIDVAVRRLTGELLYLTKIMGSRDPSPTSPPVKYVWGIVLVMRIDPRNYKEDMKFVQGNYSLGGMMWLSKDVVALYDMHNDIKPGKYPPLQHRVRNCEVCGLEKIYHM